MRNHLYAATRTRWGRFRQSARYLFAALIVQAALLFTEEAAADDRRSITANDLINIRDIGAHYLSVINSLGALSISPNGDYIAFQLQTANVRMREYDLTWYVIETKQHGKIWKIDDGGDVIVNPDKSLEVIGARLPITPQWSADNSWIFYLKQVAGNIQLWRSRKDGNVSEQLTHNDADLLAFRISDDGAKVFFTVAIPDRKLSAQLMRESDRGFLYDARFHPDKARKPLGRNCRTSVHERPRDVGIERACTPPMWVYDISTKTEEKVSIEEAERDERHPTTISFWPDFSPTADGRYYISKGDDGRRVFLKNEDPNKFPGFRPPLRLFASHGGKIFRCHANECYGHQGRFEGAWWRAERNEIVFLRADGASESMSGLYSWTPGTGAVRTIIKTEDQLADCKILKDRVICLRERWAYPRTIVSVGLDTGSVETIYDPNPEFNRIKLSEIEKIEWKDMFGNPTHGHLVYPLNYEVGRGYPLVITTYSSRGFLRGGVGDEYPIHLLAANGFMVLSHEMPRLYRRWATVPTISHAQFEDNYERRSSLSAQVEIVDIVYERGLIDRDRVAITGLSDGAAQVMFALIHSDLFAAGIASSALDYAVSYYSHNQQGRAFRRRVLGGAPDEDKNGFYRSMSLGQNAEQVNAPFLVNVSDWELQNSVESFARLQDAGTPVEMYVFPNEYHNKWQPQHRLAIYRRNVQWLKFWLMDEEDPDAVDPDQYERWRAMRNEQCVQLKDQDNAPWYCENGEVNVAPQ